MDKEEIARLLTRRNISSLSVRRGVTFTMAYLILVGFGFYSLSKLQLDLFPDVSFPMVMVITNYTGASPEDMETLITRPLEGAVSGVKNVEEVNSTSKQGISAVTVSFDWGSDMEQAETNVRRGIEMIEGLLPEDADPPIVFAFDPSMQPVVMMMVSGPYPLDELRRIAENDLQPRIERLPGIASTEVAGGLEREIQIVLDPARVSAMGLDVNSVIGAVYRENTQTPGGNITQGSLDFTIQSQGKYTKVEQIGEVVVGMKQDTSGPFPIPIPVRLKEVAKVVDGFYESQRILENDGEPAVWLMVRKQSGANTVQASGAVLDALPEIARAAAADIDFKIIFNQADMVNQALGNLRNTAMMGVLITFVVLLLFLGNFRSAVIVATAIPLSVIATFVVMNQTGITLNILSMAGLALAVGMLVDNAIVVLENIYRHLEQGKGPWAAAIDGASGVGTAVTASTLTTVSVFVPVLFVPGIAGVLFQDMAITICFSLTVSLIVARTFIPLAGSRLLGSTKMSSRIKDKANKGVFAGIRNAYGKTLDWSLRHRWVVVVGLLGVLVSTVVLAVVMRTEFMAQDDNSMVVVTVETPIGNNLAQSYTILKEVEQRLANLVTPEERKMIALDGGVGKGFISLFAKGVHAGMFRIPLVPISQRERSQQDIEEAVRKDLKKMPGIKYTTAPPFNIMGGEGDVEIQILGHNLQTSRTVGLELQQQFLAMPEISEAIFSMDDQKPEIKIVFDRPKMAQLGLSTALVSNAVSAFFQGKMAGRFSEDGDEFDIVVRYGKEHRLDIEELRKMPVVTAAGSVVPLANIAKVDVGLGPVDITRLDQGRFTKLNLTLANEYVDAEGAAKQKDLGGSIGRIDAVLQSYAWPKDFGYYIGGTAEDFMTSFKYLGLALLISVLLVYMVMASLFESLRQPFIIIFTVPLAGIGVVAIFAITNSSMDISSLIGVIMLVGIVVNNGIVMVDAANQFRDEGLERLEAIAQAARIRMRPVLMTSMTTILAMVPLALGIGEGAAGWEGMAKSVIGGLLAATLLTLYVVPTAYTIFAAKKHVTAMEQESYTAAVARGEA